MSSETKAIFDELTEDAMKLMENGEYGSFLVSVCMFVQMATKTLFYNFIICQFDILKNVILFI